MGFVNYAGVNALVSSLYGKLLTRGQYLELLSKKSVREVLDYLRGLPYYQEVLHSYPRELHRGEFEHILKQNLIKDYSKLYHFTRGRLRDFFKTLFIRFEVEDVKLLLRTVLIEHSPEKLKKEMIHMGRYSNLDFVALSSAGSIQELGSFLKDTRYSEIIQNFIQGSRQRVGLFPLEMALDIYYFQKIWDSSKKLGARDRERVRDMLGLQVDLLNIQWIYRAKKFYSIQPNVLLTYTIPIRFRLTLDDIRRLVGTHNIDEFREQLKGTPYFYLFENPDENEDILFERNLLGHLLNKALTLKIKGMHDIGKLLGYIHIKEVEMRDIFTIVEGIRYGMEEKNIAILAVNKLT